MEIPVGYLQTRDEFNKESELLSKELKLSPSTGKLLMSMLLRTVHTVDPKATISVGPEDRENKPVLKDIDTTMFMIEALSELTRELLPEIIKEKGKKDG